MFSFGCVVRKNKTGIFIEVEDSLNTLLSILFLQKINHFYTKEYPTMKLPLVIAATTVFTLASLQADLTIGFEESEKYFVGDLREQGAAIPPWTMVNGRVNIITVEDGVGKNDSRGITGIATGNASNYVYYRYQPTEAELGGQFHPSNSILRYSFDVKIDQEFGLEQHSAIFAFAVGGTTSAGEDAVMLIEVRNNGRIAANYNKGSENGFTGMDNQILPNQFVTISGIINFKEGYFTVELEGLPLFSNIQGGQLPLRIGGHKNPSILIGNINGGAGQEKHLRWMVDNITLKLEK